MLINLPVTDRQLEFVIDSLEFAFHNDDGTYMTPDDFGQLHDKILDLQLSRIPADRREPVDA